MFSDFGAFPATLNDNTAVNSAPEFLNDSRQIRYIPAMTPPTTLVLQKRRGPCSVHCDISLDTPDVAEARRDLLNGDTTIATNLLARATDPNDRAYLLEAFADWSGKPDFLDAWATSGNPTGLLIRGIHAVTWAWEARGSGRASTVSAAAASTFFTRLVAAKEDLTEAAKRNPADAAPYAWLTKVGRGMGNSTLAEESFAAGKKRSPGLRVLHSLMLQQKCAKWGGSDEEMFDFARRHAMDAPPGSGLQVLIAEAHLERYYPLRLDDPERKGYFALHADELAEAGRACFAPGTGCTGMNAVRNHNWFALTLWYAKRPAEARPHFEVIGSAPNILPWGLFVWWIDWLLNPFRRARKQCMRA